MIERHWNGWTTPEDADAYERLLTEELFPGFADDLEDGLVGYRILRRVTGDDAEEDAELVEFRTVIRFASMEDVIAFAGEEYEAAHVPPDARDLLARYDDRAVHYEIREESE